MCEGLIQMTADIGPTFHSVRCGGILATHLGECQFLVKMFKDLCPESFCAAVQHLKDVLSDQAAALHMSWQGKASRLTCLVEC